MPITFSEWLDKQGNMVLLHANCCRIAYEGGQQSMQTKVEGLQEEFAEDERFLKEQIQQKELEISNLKYLQSMDKELIQTLQKRVHEFERIFEIKWTDELPSDDECRYTHIYGVCALGRFSIEWKAWKESDFKTVYLNDDYLDNVVSIDDAKDVCIKHLKQALKGESSNG